MESISGDEFEISDGQESIAQDEKIFVAVRIRPLNGKEIAKGDASDWECVNATAIVYKNNPSERSTYPNGYTFGKLSFSHPYPCIFANFICLNVTCIR